LTIVGQTKPSRGEKKMSSTRSVRQGQIEVGIIEHNGTEYVALGATVVRRDLTSYVKYKSGHYWLTTWSGGTMLDCRSEVVERYWHGGMAVMFRLPRGRYIVGYALGDDGSLFRGELIDGCSEDEARCHCKMVAENWMEVDAEDEEAFEAEYAET
jgi:hypothetical protein